VKAAWSIRPHVILSTLGMNLAVAAGRPFYPPGTRVVLREGNSVTAYLADVARAQPWKARAIRALYRRAYALADRIICQSDYMLQDLAANLGLRKGKLVRIYNPVDIDRIRDLADQGTCPYPEGRPRLVAVGKLAYQKGYDLLLPALAQLRQRHPRAILSILGEGEERAALEAQAADLGLEGSVRFLGFRDNPYPYLKHADLFVLASRYEGFANVILEAMACGKPVVATDCPGGNREAVEPGVTGWLTRAGDAASLADAMLTAVDALPGIDPELIRARCRALYSVDRIRAEYEEQL
jgi:glycosyltransferase involved in cell wall biosynthesis